MSIIGAVVGFFIILFGGPYGVALVLALILGFVISNHLKLREVSLDLQEMKIKLEIEDDKTIYLKMIKEERLAEKMHETLEISPESDIEHKIVKE